MPFAFDLISTLVIGSMRPVATTERVMSPRSTVAIREASISFFGRDITVKPATTSPPTMRRRPRISQSLRDFLFAIYSPSYDSRLHPDLMFSRPSIRKFRDWGSEKDQNV